MQYVQCKFRKEDARSYTYDWSGEPLAIGDEVKVADRSGDGRKRVYVSGIAEEKPSFPTKPILEKIEPQPADAVPAAAAATLAITLLDDEIAF